MSLASSEGTPAGSRSCGDDVVAIVGMACRLPGAPDVRAFRALLRSGRDGISRPDRAELLRRGVDPGYTGRDNFVAAMGVIEDSRRFDWSFFRYSRSEAAAMDPQQRVFLECAATAIDDAGLDPTRSRARIGVYAGADRSGPGRDGARLSELARYIGREKDFVATRVAYKLGLRGPAITVQTACSTSLTAVHLAVRALLGGECDAALAGGVTVMPDGEWGYLYEPGGILAQDGYCRPFDARSGGTVPSEGVGVVVLKRLSDAVRDGDRIAAVIAGTAVNNDGADKMAYTAPSAAGQSEVIRAALDTAGLVPGDIGHVEAHGTATRLGDPIEVQALTEVFGAVAAEGGAGAECALGAVKGNVGHTGAAAGVTGLIKTALMLEQREIYPTAHYTAPNPLLELERSPFTVAVRCTPWEQPSGRRARAGAVSSFGVGGTNAHAVLTEPPLRARRTATVAQGPRLLPLSAHSHEALAQYGTDLAEHFDGGPAEQGAPPELDSAVRTLAGRRPHRLRRALLVRDRADAPAALRSAGALAGRGSTPGRLGKVAFLFPGQGTLKSAAGASAYRLLPEFRAAFDELRKLTLDACDVDLGPVVATAEAGPDAEAWYADTVHQQLGLFALGLSYGRQLAAWDITPHLMLGNSIGEYAAAALAEVWSLPDAVAVVHRRAEAMRAAEPGAMALVEAEPAEVEARLPAGCGVTVAVHGNGSAVLSGPVAAMDLLLGGEALHGLRTIPVRTRRAFHSPAMNSAAEAVRDHLSSVPARPPRLPYVSNTTGVLTDPEAAVTPGHWAAHLREPVRLDTGTRTLLEAGCTTYLELGPGGSMAGVLRAAPGWDPGYRSLRLAPAGQEEAGLVGAIGALWELGVDRALETVMDSWYAGTGERPTRCSLPARPFLGQDPALVEVPPPATALPASPEPAATAPAATAPAAPAPAATAPAPTALVHPARATAAPAHRSASGPSPESVPAAGRPGRRALLEDAWCRTLGVAAAQDEDDFFALGGDSLLTLALATAVRERAGVDVSLTDFSNRPTFAGLLDLVGPGPSGGPDHAAAPPAATPGVATLRAGTGRPVHLVTDALGHALPYRELAARLDLEGDRPVLGLERPAVPGASIRALAAAHARTLLRHQPTGPYTLGGWSLGAVIAHECARLLIRHGRAVDLLISLDGYVPDTRPLPVATAPDFLYGGVRAGLDTLLGSGPLAARLGRSSEARRRFLAGQAAVLAHRPRPLDCPAVLFKAAAGPAAAARLARRLASLYPAGLRVVPVAGDHWSMLRSPHADVLAVRIREALVRDARPAHRSPDCNDRSPDRNERNDS